MRTSTTMRALTMALAGVMIAACDSGRTASTSLPSSPTGPAVSGLIVTPPQATLFPNNSVAVTASVVDANSTPNTSIVVTWVSSDSRIATVASTGNQSARVTAVSPGSVTVTASVEGHSASAAVVVAVDTVPHYAVAFVYTEAEGFITIPMPAGVYASRAHAINDAGQVVGEMATTKEGGCLHAFIWSRGAAAVDLGTLSDPQPGPCGAGVASAAAINRQGEVVGYASTNSGWNHAFKWSPATGMVDLGISPGGRSSYAYGINDGGVVVGNLDVGAGPWQPFRWSSGRGMEVLSTPAGFGGLAGGINADGIVVGGVIAPDDPYGFDPVGAVLWKPDGQRVDFSMCADCQALAINRTGQVVGTALTHPVRWGQSAADVIELASTYGYAFAINDLGQSVGSIYDTDGRSTGFLWSAAGGLRYLPQPVNLVGHASIYPQGINALGQVVGYFNP